MKKRFKKIYDTYTLLLKDIENIHNFRYSMLLITLISKYFGHKITYMHKCKINELRYYAFLHNCELLAQYEYVGNLNDMY